MIMEEKPENMDCYPWAVPTEEQRRMFDALSYDEQLKMVQDAITEGLESGQGSDGETFMAELIDKDESA